MQYPLIWNLVHDNTLCGIDLPNKIFGMRKHDNDYMINLQVTRVYYNRKLHNINTIYRTDD